ncbi:MAG: hypothetical protein LBJ89_02035 [Holosporales bacterium]|jgi:hypothetical protein|nr:hypothetical protein [Holosporales bacterium]
MKKSLLLGTVLAVISGDTGQSRVTGFYVGVMGSCNVLRFKLIDASSHPSGQTVKNKASKETIYLFNGASLLLPVDGSEVSGAVNQVLTESDSFAALEKAYKVRPSAAFFFGGQFQIGRNLFVGLEGRVSKDFGSFLYEGDGKLPALKEFTVADDNKSIKTKSEIASVSCPLKVEINKKVVFDAYLRVGANIPGSDGRFRVYLGGGGGAERTELTVAETGAGFRYMCAVADSALHTGKLLTATTLDAAKPGDNASIAAYFGAAFLKDAIYNMRVFTGVLTDNKVYGASADDVRNGATDLIVEPFLYGANTNHEFQAQFNKLLKDPSCSITKWRPRFGGIVGFEYDVSRSVSLRFECSVAYTKKLKVEQLETISPLTAEAIESGFEKAIKDGTFTPAINQLIDNDNVAIFASEKSSEAQRDAIAAKFKDQFKKGLSDGKVELGKFNYAYVLKKQIETKFSAGVSVRF